MKKNEEYYIYIVLCENNTLYTGITNNLIKRFIKHKLGKGANYTKIYKPLMYLSVWIVENKSLALKIEKFIKSNKKNKKLFFIKNKKSLEKYYNNITNDRIKIKNMCNKRLEVINSSLLI